MFCSGIFLGFLARLGLEARDNAAMQIAVNLLGAVAMVAVAGLTAWYRGKGRAVGTGAGTAAAGYLAGSRPD